MMSPLVCALWTREAHTHRPQRTRKAIPRHWPVHAPRTHTRTHLTRLECHHTRAHTITHHMQRLEFGKRSRKLCKIKQDFFMWPLYGDAPGTLGGSGTAAGTSAAGALYSVVAPSVGAS